MGMRPVLLCRCCSSQCVHTSKHGSFVVASFRRTPRLAALKLKHFILYNTATAKLPSRRAIHSRTFAVDAPRARHFG